MSFDAEKYWGDHEYKVWIVGLETASRKNPKRDTKIVRARDESKAIHTARFHTMLKGKVYCSARLATPRDLGISE